VSARVVLTTYGSFGDLHPYIAVALELQRRGHAVTLATHEYYRGKVEALGLSFHPLRPDVHENPELGRRVMDLRGGPEYIVRELFMPALRDSYADTTEATRGADLVVSHPLAFAVRLVAELRKIRWASALLAPLSFFSAYDPPVLPARGWVSALRPLGPTLYRPLFGLMRRTVGGWCRPVQQFRAELGLPPAPDPLFTGQHSPQLVLALYSSVLGAPQPDWPPNVCVTGFPFFDQDREADGQEELSRFLDAGPPPIVFTLGTSGVLDAGRFYLESAEAAKRLGRRAVLLVGRGTANRPQLLPDGVAAFDYAPFSELFPRAAAIVHQGGVGTTAQALRAGRPMFVVPFAHDQPDNADRVMRIGAARVLPRARYTAARAAAELRALLDEPRYAARAAEVSRQVRAEDGAVAAADALERLLAAPAGRPLGATV
jgi:UDP:flavonoid glycosyltransferase YjiC (YdhE family)